MGLDDVFLFFDLDLGLLELRVGVGECFLCVIEVCFRDAEVSLSVVQFADGFVELLCRFCEAVVLILDGLFEEVVVLLHDIHPSFHLVELIDGEVYSVFLPCCHQLTFQSGHLSREVTQQLLLRHDRVEHRPIANTLCTESVLEPDFPRSIHNGEQVCRKTQTVSRREFGGQIS